MQSCQFLQGTNNKRIHLVSGPSTIDVQYVLFGEKNNVLIKVNIDETPNLSNVVLLTVLLVLYEEEYSEIANIANYMYCVV